MLLLFWYIKVRKGTTFFLDMQEILLHFSYIKARISAFQYENIPQIGRIARGEFLFFREWFVRIEYLRRYFDRLISVLAIDAIDGFL